MTCVQIIDRSWGLIGDDVPVKVGDAIVNVPFALLESEAKAEEIKVMILESRFDAKEVTVQAGMTILWYFEGSLPHTVTADGEMFDSGILNKSQTFSFTFEQAGTYPYYCTLNGGLGGKSMFGTIVVTGS